MTTVAGTSYPQREALRSLAHACRRAGGAVPAPKMLLRHVDKLGKLMDLGLVEQRQGETFVHRNLVGVEHEYVGWVYEPTTSGHALLARTEGEPAPPPTPLRDEHWAILKLLVAIDAPRTAGSIADRLDGDLNTRQVAARLSLLARHGFAGSLEGEYMEPTKWYFTAAGEKAAAANGGDHPT
jgi:hypothetical protein